jgi:hypothetical protein
MKVRIKANISMSSVSFQLLANLSWRTIWDIVNTLCPSSVSFQLLANLSWRTIWDIVNTLCPSSVSFQLLANLACRTIWSIVNTLCPSLFTSASAVRFFLLLDHFKAIFIYSCARQYQSYYRCHKKCLLSNF